MKNYSKKFMMKFKLAYKIFRYLVNAIWAIPLVLSSRLLYPWILIRFGAAESRRIGHFIPDTLEELIRLQGQNPRSLTFWSTSGISNIQWYKMVKDYIYIHPIYKYPVFWNKYIPKSDRHIALGSENSGRDIKGKFFFNLVKPKMSTSDTRKSEAWLKSIGWSGEPIICLLSRDETYLLENDRMYNDIKDRSYHDYRNCEIQTFKSATQFLTERGYWVFRMGTKTKERLEIAHKNFLDYSFTDNKSALLDIYLFSNCAGVISTGTGIDQLSFAYGIPGLIVNGIPLASANTFHNVIFYPKNLVWSQSNINLSIKQYLENNFGNTSEYTTAGIKVKNLSDREILLATIEFVDRIEGLSKYDSEDLFLQEKFLNILSKSRDYSKNHEFIHPKFKIAKEWIFNMKDNFI
jgi:putative glycosyltransferase (TIGR04372 family)